MTVAVAETRVIFEEGVRVRVEFERERVVYKVGTVRVERVRVVVFGKDSMGGVVVTAPKTEVATPPRMEVMSEMRPRARRCSALGMVSVWLPVGIGMVRVFTEEVVVPYELDEVTRLIVDGQDKASFALVAGLTVGEFRDWLLSDAATGEMLAAVSPGITPEMAAAVKATLEKTLGAANVFTDPVEMGSEDVGIFGLPDHSIPTVYFRLGAMNADRYAQARAAGKTLPGMHTSRFEPDPEPTLATGVKSLTAVAIAQLQ